MPASATPPRSTTTTAAPRRLTRAEYVARNAELFEQRSAIVARLASLDAKRRPTDADRTEMQRLRNRLGEVTAEIVDANRGLVRGYVNRFLSHTSPEDSRDFEHAGVVGLIRAINTYDPTRGPFAQWAYRPIKREVLRSVHSAEFPNMNSGDFERRPDVLRAVERLRDRGAPVTVDAIVEESGASEGQVRRVLGAPHVLSLSQPIAGEDGDIDVAETIGDGAPDIADGVIARMANVALEHRGLDSLSTRERFVLVRRFGLDGEPVQRLSTIGVHLGVSREAVRQIEVKALAKLAHPAVLYWLVHTSAAGDAQ